MNSNSDKKSIKLPSSVDNQAITTLFEYSKLNYNENKTRFDRLDSKATSVIGWCGVIVALQTYILQYIKGENLPTFINLFFIIMAASSFFCFLIAMYLCVKTYSIKLHTKLPDPEEIRDWFYSHENNDKTNERLEKLLFIRIDAASKSLDSISDIKVVNIKKSLYLFITGIMLSVMAVLAQISLILF